MKVEKHADGKIKLILESEDCFDEFFVWEFSARVLKGQTVEAEVDSQGRLVLGVEK